MGNAGRGLMAAAGGVLNGIGEGMVQSGKEKRAMALEALRQDRQDQRTQADMIFRSSEAQTSRTFKAGESEKDRDFRETAQLRDIAAKLAGKGGISANDKRLVDVVTKRHTKKKDSVSGEATDWDAVANDLTRQGRADLAGYLSDASGAQGGTASVDLESPEWAKAETLAGEWVKDQAGWFSGDGADFSGYGGNRTEAKRQKALEIYGELTGKAAGGASQAAAPGMDSAAWMEGAVPSGGASKPPYAAQGSDQGHARPVSAEKGTPEGGGTRDNPYRAASQADILWFKKAAPKGAYIKVDGKMYVK